MAVPNADEQQRESSRFETVGGFGDLNTKYLVARRESFVIIWSICLMSHIEALKEERVRKVRVGERETKKHRHPLLCPRENCPGLLPVCGCACSAFLFR